MNLRYAVPNTSAIERRNGTARQMNASQRRKTLVSFCHSEADLASAILCSMEFEWDPNKAASNWRKHGVSFEEAASVLGDVLSITVPDPHHSQQETRFLTVGESIRGRMLIVAHTEEDAGYRIRIISARELTAGERKAYEEGAYE